MAGSAKCTQSAGSAECADSAGTLEHAQSVGRQCVHSRWVGVVHTVGGVGGVRTVIRVSRVRTVGGEAQCAQSVGSTE